MSTLDKYFPDKTYHIDPNDHLLAFLDLKMLEDTRTCGSHVTDAAFLSRIIDGEAKILDAQQNLNDIPEALKPYFSPMDQLLDTDFADQLPEGQKPLKMQQSSPTVHAETRNILASKIPDDVDAAQVFKIGYINNMLCPRCMANVSLWGIDLLILDRHVLDQGWVDHRRPYVDLSLHIAGAGGICLRPNDVAEDVNDSLWRPYGQKRDMIDALTFEKDVEEKQVFENINAANTTLNPLFGYSAAVFVEREGQTYLASASQCLVPGLSVEEYTGQYRGQETKYSVSVSPVTALLILLKRYGFERTDNTVYVTGMPVMRDIINGIAGGTDRFVISIPDFTSENFAKALDANKDNVREQEHSTNRRTYRIYQKYAALHVISKAVTFEIVS